MPNRKKIKTILSEQGITQRELAEKLSLPESHISLICQGKIDIRESTLKKMCEILHIEAKDIW